MSDNYIKNVVEAALLAAGRPLQLAELAQLFNDQPDGAALRAAIEALQADYAERGIEVKETANGFRIQVRKDLASEVSRLWPERPPRYSRALLETLALIAYRQPITRAEIEAVRGVAVNPNIIKTVIERNWVRVVGTRDVPGRPELLGTTKDFLDYFGLRALDELPPLAELKAMGEINLQLDLAKPDEPGSDEGSSGSGGASGADEGGASGSAPPDSSVAAAGAEGAEPGDDAGVTENVPSVATEALTEVASAETAATDDAQSDAVVGSVEEVVEEVVAYEHDPHAATITHVDIEADSADPTVEVEALHIPEDGSKNAAIETGEFEMAELGMTAKPATALEAEFDADEVGSVQTEDDDEEELSAAPQSSTELVAAPRDRDD